MTDNLLNVSQDRKSEIKNSKNCKKPETFTLGSTWPILTEGERPIGGESSELRGQFEKIGLVKVSYRLIKELHICKQT